MVSCYRIDALQQQGMAQTITCLDNQKKPFAGGEDHYAFFIEDPSRIKAEFVAT